MLSRRSMIISHHLLSRLQTAMNILRPAIGKSIIARAKTKQIGCITVREFGIIQCMLLLMKPISVIAELCYLLRYPVRHGRKSGCPFSIRQMAIYQRFDHVKKTSRWIFVQAPDDFADELRSELLLKGREKIPPSNIYRQIFLVAEQEWRDYICYLDAELATLVRCNRRLQSLILTFFNSSLGRKGVLCRCRRLQ